MLTQFRDENLLDIMNLFHQAYQADEMLGIHFAAATIRLDTLKQHLTTTPLFLKKVGDELATTVAVRLPWSQNPSPFILPHLGWVATLPKFQGRGLAKELLIEVISNYIQASLKAPAVTLGTAAEHPWLIAAYRKMGFEYLTEIQKFSDHKTVYMIKVLDSENLAFVKDEVLQKLLKEKRG